MGTAMGSELRNCLRRHHKATENPSFLNSDKLLSITDHQGRANWNHKEISPHTCLSGSHRKSTNPSAGEDVEKRGPLCVAGGTANWHSHCGKQPGGFLKTRKMELPRDPALPGIYLKKSKTPIQKDLCTLCSRSIIYNSEGLEATRVPIRRWMDKEVWYIYTLEYYSAIQRN